MNEFNNDDEIYNNEIDDLNDIKIENDNFKINKYNEDEIVFDEKMNYDGQNNIINDNNNINNNMNQNLNLNENIDNNNNNEFTNNIDENNINDGNNDDYNNNFDTYNILNDNGEENYLYENENENNLISEEGEEINNNYFNNINDFNQENTNNQELNDINSLKIYIVNLEKKCSELEKENKKLKSKQDPNYIIVENSIKQGTILLEDVKRKNYNLNQKIKTLEKQNLDLNYKIIELNQKLKRCQNNTRTNNIIHNTNKDMNSIILKLNNKIDESEIIISKLKFEKKLLEKKLSEDKKYHENELNLMLNYKNSELSVYQKAINDFKSNNNKNISQTKNNKDKIKKFSKQNKSLENTIKTLQKNLSQKDSMINSLNKKIIELEGNFDLKCIEMQQISTEQETKIAQLINEKNELIKNNEKLSNGLMQFDSKVKEANLIFINKTDFYDKSLTMFNTKIKEYKNKIILLKKKIKELNTIIEKGNNNINNNFNNNKLNDVSIYQKNMSLTPGSFILPKRKMTPYTQKYFDGDNDGTQNNSMYLNKTNIDIIENRNNNALEYLNRSQISQRNENININNLDYEEDNKQKIFLKKYKSFLTQLKV